MPYVERLGERTLLATFQGTCEMLTENDYVDEPNSLVGAMTVEGNLVAAPQSPSGNDVGSAGQGFNAVDAVFANETEFLEEVTIAAGDGNGDGEAGATPDLAHGDDSEVNAPASTQPTDPVELASQTEAPIIAQALFQRLTPRPPLPPAVIQEIHLNPSTGVVPGPAHTGPRDLFVSPGSHRGVYVATGDLNNDGLADVIVGSGPSVGPVVDDLKDQRTSRVVFSPIPADNGNALHVSESQSGQVQANPSLTGGALKRIDQLLHDIQVLQKAKDDLGFFSDPMGGRRKSLQDQIDRKFAEIDRILKGK